MKNKAKQLLAEWENKGMPGFFLDFFSKETGFEIGSAEFEEVQDLLMEGKI